MFCSWNGYKILQSLPVSVKSHLNLINFASGRHSLSLLSSIYSSSTPFKMKFTQRLSIVSVLAAHVYAQSVTVVYPQLTSAGGMSASIVTSDASQTVLALYCFGEDSCSAGATETVGYTQFGTSSFNAVLTIDGNVDTAACNYDTKTGAVCTSTVVTDGTTGAVESTYSASDVVPVTIPVTGGADKSTGAVTSATSSAAATSAADTTVAAQTSSAGGSVTSTSASASATASNAAGSFGVEAWVIAAAGLGAAVL
jgi:hypothetical protein